jgi:hypothetical protein
MIYSKVYAPARVKHKHIRTASAHIGRLTYLTRTQLTRKINNSLTDMSIYFNVAQLTITNLSWK